MYLAHDYAIARGRTSARPFGTLPVKGVGMLVKQHTDAIIRGAKVKVTYDPRTATVRIVADKSIFSRHGTHAYRKVGKTAIHHLSTPCEARHLHGRAWRIACRLFDKGLVEDILVITEKSIRFEYTPPREGLAANQLIANLLPTLVA